MAKRILFALMCTLLVLVIVMGIIVFDKVNTLLSVAQPPQGTPGTQQTEPPATESEPSEPSEPSRPTEPPHEHHFVLTESIPATCAAFGYNVYSCECGKNHMPADEFSNPLGHNYEAGEPVELTCTQDGYTPYTCSRCEDVDKRDFQEAQGHTLGAGLVTKPTCEEDGYTTATCSICEEEIVSDIVEAPGHDYSDWATVAEPGDATPGKRQRICATCEDVETELIQPTGTLEIKNEAVTTLTDDEDTEYLHYVITVGTEATPDAYTYTVDSYMGALTFTYDGNGLSVSRTEAPDEEPTVLDPYESSELILKPASPASPDLDDPDLDNSQDPEQNEETN